MLATWRLPTGKPVTDADRQPTSRLSCQIKMSEALDGIVLHVPG